jgi:hypothetical protein
MPGGNRLYSHRDIELVFVEDKRTIKGGERSIRIEPVTRRRICRARVSSVILSCLEALEERSDDRVVLQRYIDATLEKHVNVVPFLLHLYRLSSIVEQCMHYPSATSVALLASLHWYSALLVCQ